LVLAGGIAAASLGSLATISSWQFGTSFNWAMALALTGCATYLIQKPGRFWKWASGIVGLTGLLTWALSYLALSSYQSGRLDWDLSEMLRQHQFPGQLVQSLLVIAATVAAGWAATKLTPPDTRKQTTMAALLAGGTGWAVNAIGGAALLRGSFGTILLIEAVGDLPFAVGVGLMVKLASMLCLFKSRRMVVSGGAKAWFIICLVASIIGVIVTAALSGGVAANLGAADFFVILFGFGGVVGYLLLARSRRIGYVLILLSAGLSVFTQVSYHLARLISLGGASGPGAEEMGRTAASALLYSLLSLVNPVITSAVVANAWKTVPADPPLVRQRVPVLFKVFSVFALTLGVAGLMFGSWGFLQIEAAPEAVVFVGMLLPATIAVVGLFATIACFDPTTRTSKGLPIAAIVVAGLPFLVFLLAMIAYLTDSHGSSNNSAGRPTRAASASSQTTLADDDADTKDVDAGESEHLQGLPRIFSAHGNTYQIDSFTVTTSAEGNTVIKAEGSGFDKLPFRDGSLVAPIGCDFIADGQEWSWENVAVNADGAEFQFETDAEPDTVIFYPNDDETNRVEVPVN
jgi:hypothetical protein